MTAYLNSPYATLAIGLAGVFAGFVGADIAPDTLIERTLWPQRAYNGINARNFLKASLLLPAGGPLQQTVRKAIDNFFRHSLQKGAGKGHMLGTAFFPDTGITYKVHPGSGQPAEHELVRNGLLVRALQCMPQSIALMKEEAAAGRRMRQRITVSHLELFNFENIPPKGAITLDAGDVSTKTIFALFASEIPAILLALFVAGSWNSLAGIVFLIPLVLKVLAALTTIEREDLIIPNEKTKSFEDLSRADPKFEIHIPGEGFQVISGPADLVLPFFRHYGHPIRCRWREVTQMALIGAQGLNFPITLALSIFWMPPKIQALWTAYQIYLTIAMLIARYGGGELWGTTEEQIGQALADAENHGRNGMVVLKNRTGEMIGARLSRTVHGSYTDGKTQVMQIVSS